MKNTYVYIVLLYSVIQLSFSSDDHNQTAPLTCSCQGLKDEIESMLDQSHLVMKHLGKLPVYAASSCQQIHELKPESPSGMYWIQSNSGPSRVYCQMEEGGCGHGVWMRVANVNMTATGANCPSGLVRALSSRPLCRRSTDSCSSTFFSNFDVPFHNVCGKIIAYQYYSQMHFIHIASTKHAQLMTCMWMESLLHTATPHDNTFGHLLLDCRRQSQLM